MVEGDTPHLGRHQGSRQVTAVQSVVKGDNGTLIAEAARLWIREGDIVLDMTYGRGLFWSEYIPPGLLTNDLYADGADFRYDFMRLPMDTHTFDVAVFDPPYETTGTKSKSTVPDMLNRYGIDETGPANLHELRRSFYLGCFEAYRVLRPGGRLLFKCADYVESGRYQQGRKWAIEAAEAADFRQVDEFIHHSGTGPQPLTNLDGTPRRQVTSRRAHSVLCVFETKRSKPRKAKA